VYGTLAPPAQQIARSILQRLVTPQRTRAVIDSGALRGLAVDPASVERVLDHLVRGRLLIVQRDERGGGSTVELVHESLIARWPAFQRWLDEGHEDAVLLAQIRTAATQWDQKGRSPGLAWRGEQEREARLFRDRYRGELSERERSFLDAVLRLGDRSARIRRGILIGSLALTGTIAVASAIALAKINDARDSAVKEAARAQVGEQRAKEQEGLAKEQTSRAVTAEERVKRELDELKAEQTKREAAEGEARDKGQQVVKSKEELEREVVVAEKARQEAEVAKAKAEAAAAAEKQTREQAQRLYEEERRRNDEAQKMGKQIMTKLK
jgi:hypothetical protein